MDPWLILSWVSAICLTIIISGVTILFLAGFAKTLFKRKSKDGWAPVSVSVFQGKGD